MSIKKTSLTVLFIFAISSVSYAGTCWNGGSSGSSPWSVVDSPSGSGSVAYADVNYCVNTVAGTGDTVNVPTGSATWSSLLEITGSVNLIGAGVGNTVITRGAWLLIRYIPADYSLNQTFRLSGFSFNGAGGRILRLGEELYPTAKPANTNIRVDNNRFYSSMSVSFDTIALEHFGNIFGVVDNNIFDSYAYPMRNQNPSAYGVLWDQAIAGTPGYPLGIPGSIYNLYFEDNTMNLALVGGEAAMTNSQFEGRYAYRYNQINFPASGQSFYLFDVHGHQGSGMFSPFISENYGNRLVTNGSKIGYVNIRGGKNYWHHNSATTAVSYSYSSSAVSCPAEKYRAGNMVHDSYMFQNRIGFTGALRGASIDDGGVTCEGYGGRPLEGTDFFDDVNSSPGITCGTIGNIPGSCSVGQGYWATAQSCSDLTGMVGVDPSTPIDGTLWKCISTNTWTAFYTPYTYPHPLRSGASITTTTPKRPMNPGGSQN